MSKKPTVELKLPILKNMELVATQTAEVVSKHMDLSEDKASEISMALIEACINAFEHSESKSEIYIHFLIDDDNQANGSPNSNISHCNYCSFSIDDEIIFNKLNIIWYKS